MTKPFTKPRVLPLAWMSLALAASYTLNRWYPVATLIPRPFHWAGLVLTIPGLALLLHSAFLFIRQKTGLLPFSEASSLVSSGLYRFSRNPMYLGMLVFLLGVALFLGSVGAVCPVIIFGWIIHHRFIRNEELFLAERFGEEYEAYRKKVRRWI